MSGLRFAAAGRRAPGIAAACFAGGFAAMVLFGEMLPPGVRNESYVWQRHTRLDASWRVTEDGGQQELYAGGYGFMDSARRADVLLLGNSRLLFALRHQQLLSFSERTGVRIFNLGFGCHEPYELPLRLIARHGLRPKIVVVNADGFFIPALSQAALEALEADREPAPGERWPRLRTAFEDATATRIKTALQPWLPRWGDVLPSGPEDLRPYRSTADGSWMLAPFDAADRRRLIDPLVGGAERMPPDDPAAIAVFGQAMRSLGAEVVVTLVPHPQASRERAESAAAALGAPLVVPRLEGLSFFDGSHLDADNARRFAAAFFAELESLPAFRQLREAVRRDPERPR